jgi:hypothetical protein
MGVVAAITAGEFIPTSLAYAERGTSPAVRATDRTIARIWRIRA